MATRIEKTDLARDALYDKVNTMIDEVNTKIDNKDSLPSQTGKAGKFLTTDGTNASWGEVKQIKIAQNLTNPSADTVPSTKAVKTAIDAKDSLPSQAGNNGKFLTTDGTTASWADIDGGLEIGDIGFSPLGINESQNKRRYLNGQVISQAQFVSFTNKIKAAIKLTPSLATSETNWQAEVTNSKLGQCGKFVIDDTTGTIRLPKIVNINGLQDLSLLGGIKAESLPNIKGGFTSYAFKDNYKESSGSFTAKNKNINSTGGNAGSSYGSIIYDFDASRSSSTYQDNAPVQQEAIQYPYFIQVATGVEESVDVTREIELNNPFSLLDYKWSEYEITNASWLLSNGQFNSGATYPAVYELLLKIKNGTETKAGVSVKLSTEAYTDTDFVINTADTTFRLPIKVKLASGNRVAGNGMTLGLTNGTQNTGLITGTDTNNLASTTGNYGQDVGIAVSGTTSTRSKSLGVTQDPTKSGIETSSSGLKLYFYVGETIQDANVIAASQVLTKVANGIDRTVATDRETVVGWSIPDYNSGITLTFNKVITNAGESKTMAKSGLFCFEFLVNNVISTIYFYVNNRFVGKIGNSQTSLAFWDEINFPVTKGDVVKVTAETVGGFTAAAVESYLFPYKGSMYE